MRNLLGLLLLSLCLSSSAYSKVYDYTHNNRLSLIEDPRTSVDLKVELIRSAKHHINIVTFFWDDSAVPARLAVELNKAHDRGVEVRILTSYIATLGTDPLGKGKRNLNLKSKNHATYSYLSLTPGTSFSVNNSLHEKIFVIDGEKAIIGGRNASNSSLSGKDLEVLMEGPVVNQVQDHFKRMFDFIIDQRISTHCNQNDSVDSQCVQEYKKLEFSSKDANFFPEQAGFTGGEDARILSHEALIHQKELGLSRSERLTQQDDILDTVTKIEFKKLRAYNYFIIPTPKYKKFLEDSLAEGDSIEMITNSYESAKFSSNYGYIYSIPDAMDLVEDGLELHQWQRNQKLNYVHEKVMIFDEDHVIVGSHNFGVGSTAVSNEIAIEFKSKPIADRLIEVFEYESGNPAITMKADLNFLEQEYEKYKMQIKILRMKIVEGILREIY
ncbi:phosphatidylserine/phosphatidylglycerophosphate/cardiolipin synthase family protein [Bacteriovorax sp. PP10]|uniref:Phosphatidylserine/phosphatidylglycerophosphate/ cardiolipin synthase family protein n=1 Tax=Bacteriovorax antarcticus TaxID=3088717 RepID=A0ABU5VWP7_9BACT|nr:phosphatidylserine/phosphatidylglycerophosphate/cardiolipin synthase family protein [Bacteriovorax sp. PP10]MEA9357484.1 phosphatidylserine/phosphatidylglycerophosphate/cardiolipin synthase family protein [Bacteriovorax sp. PP10]